MTVSDAFSAYDADVLYTKALKTRRNYRSALNSFVKAVGDDLPVNLIEYPSIIQWKRYMAERGVQASSQASNLSRFREVFKYLKKHKIPMSLDYEEIDRPTVKSKPPTWMNLKEVKAFLGVIESPRDKAIFSCLFSSGARISELLQLNRESIIRLDDGYAKAAIIGKGDKPGELSFDPSCLAILDVYLESRPDSFRPLFISAQHSRLTVSRVEQLCHEYADMAGIDKNITPHVWRHTFATMLKENGMGIYDLKVQLRHERISTTQIYVHTEPLKEEKYKAFHTPVPIV